MAPRKNANIVRDLPRVVPEPGAWRDEVEAAKNKVADRTPAALASEYERLRVRRDACDEKYKRAMRATNAAVEAVEELIPAAFLADEQARGLAPYTRESLITAGNHRVGVSPEIETKITDNDALLAWVQNNDLGRLLTIYAPKVKALVKERLRDGKPVPAGVEVRATDRVTFVKA